MMPNRILSPFSHERLREMYETELMSAHEIIDSASLILGYAISDALVYRWLQEAHIERRCPRDANKAKQFRSPEYSRKLVLLSKIGNECSVSSSRHPSKNPDNNMSQRKRETRVCAWIECSNTITRSLGQFKSSSGRTYCCSSHAAKHQQWFIREVDIRNCALPECSKTITRSLKRFTSSSGRAYCCLSHANQHQQLLKHAENKSGFNTETRICSWVECNNLITRPVSNFTASVNVTCCCISHSRKHRAWLKRQQKEQPTLPLDTEKVSIDKNNIETT